MYVCIYIYIHTHDECQLKWRGAPAGRQRTAPLAGSQRHINGVVSKDKRYNNKFAEGGFSKGGFSNLCASLVQL